MVRINFYTLKMVKEDSVLYEVPVIKSPAEVYQAAKQLLHFTKSQRNISAYFV